MESLRTTIFTTANMICDWYINDVSGESGENCVTLIQINCIIVKNIMSLALF